MLCLDPEECVWWDNVGLGMSCAVHTIVRRVPELGVGVQCTVHEMAHSGVLQDVMAGVLGDVACGLGGERVVEHVLYSADHDANSGGSGLRGPDARLHPPPVAAIGVACQRHGKLRRRHFEQSPPGRASLLLWTCAVRRWLLEVTCPTQLPMPLTGDADGGHSWWVETCVCSGGVWWGCLVAGWVHTGHGADTLSGCAGLSPACTSRLWRCWRSTRSST